jgi:hypothetical protein
MKIMTKKIRKNSERGQAIILIAFAIVGLVAIVGLMIDGGILLIEYARLKRGIDSASIAAASQFRKPLDGAAGDAMGLAMEKAGEEFLQFNQSVADVTVETCEYPGTNHSADLCPGVGEPARKLVRVTADRYVNFGFMRIVGLNGTTITATSEGEAASIDLVLAIDTSASMAYETTVGGNPNQPDPADPADPVNHPGDDPEVCNAYLNDPTRRCEPMGKIKDVAVNFVDQLFFPYDRVAVVAFTEQTPGGSRNVTDPVLQFNDNEDASGNPTTEIQAAIRGLKALQLPRCDVTDPTYPGSCLYFDPTFKGIPCMPKTAGNGDPSACGSSNFGGGLTLAGNQFAEARQESFWVVIALIGGPANATDPVSGDPNGYCPNTGGAGQPTWSWPGSPAGKGLGFCRDRDPMPASYDAATYNPNTFNWSGYDWTTQTRHYVNPVTHVADPEYDADDYARDAADYITSPKTGQGAVLFTVCLGSYCRDYPSTDPASAEHLGQYMSLHAGDDLTAVPPVVANHGLYFYTENTSGLEGVFDTIAENIFTRISQ